jgi:aryl-alcohol dehydrogenase-like predicted oxidoreductase
MTSSCESSKRARKNLRTDHIDLYHMHNFQPKKGDTSAKARESAWKAAVEAREQGIIRNFGVTGHSGADILIEVVKAYEPDALLTIFPANRPDHGKYEDELLPLAMERNMGVIKVWVNEFEPPVMTADDATYLSGAIGFGSFDDRAAFETFHVE